VIPGIDCCSEDFSREIYPCEKKGLKDTRAHLMAKHHQVGSEKREDKILVLKKQPT